MDYTRLAKYVNKVVTEIGPLILEMCKDNEEVTERFQSLIDRFNWAAPEMVPEFIERLVEMCNYNLGDCNVESKNKLKKLLLEW